MKILAVDPGGKTGYVWWHSVGEQVLGYGEMTPEEFVEHWRFQLDYFDVVVCEEYIITPQTLKKTRQLDALYLIGWLKHEARLEGPEFVLQRPSMAKTFADDDKLKTMDWYHPTPGGHQNDAHRHLLVYLVENKLMALGRLLHGSG